MTPPSLVIERVERLLPHHLPMGRLSIAVFGPGEGEAIVARLPDGSLGVVDGCSEPNPGDTNGAGDPVRELLKDFERNADAHGPFRLSFVCLTHPHADHYRGLGRLLDAYGSTVERVWAVSQITPKHGQLLEKWARLTHAGRASYPDDKDRRGLMRVIDSIDRAKKNSSRGISHLSNGKSLLRGGANGELFSVEACGPSDDDVDQAAKDLIETLSAATKGKSLARAHDPNVTSGALLLRWGTSAVLLAGDLLRGSGPRSGWQRAREHVEGRVQVVNVAHHASDEAHDTVLWKAMQPGIAIVTPFKSAIGRQPPRPTQIHSLLDSAMVAITSPPAWVGEPGCPVPRHGLSRRGVGPTIDGPIVTQEPNRNAVAVSLDASGNILSFTLAGAADVYDAPPAVAPAAPAPA